MPLVVAGQRGTAAWTGGSDIRVLFDTVMLGKVNRRGEMMHAAGDLGMELPDMTRYGEGSGGVMLVTDMSGNYDAGRTFDLHKKDDVARLARDRRPNPLNPGLVTYLGDAYMRLKTGTIPAYTASDPAEWMPGLDAEVESDMAPDLRELTERPGRPASTPMVHGDLTA